MKKLLVTIDKRGNGGANSSPQGFPSVLRLVALSAPHGDGIQEARLSGPTLPHKMATSRRDALTQVLDSC
jgi:hypothetical protein